MKLVRGTLYFISEVDVLSGQTFDYYKIGLVKESRQGDSLDRAGEHQTGNPRRLIVRSEIETPAINDLETMMHDLYATERIFGEWFVLPGASFKKTVAKAQAVADEQAALEPMAVVAAEVAALSSNDTLLPATPEMLSWYHAAYQAKHELRVIKDCFDAERQLFESLTKPQFDTSRFFTITPKSKSSFDEDRLAAERPDLYRQFVEAETKLSTSFTLTADRTATYVGPKKLAKAVDEQNSRLSTAAKRPTEAALQEIHIHHLELLANSAAAKWREDVAQTQLRASIGNNAGIESVAKWTRKIKTTEKFNQIAFKQQYPELTAEYTTTSCIDSFAIVDMRSYSF
jgi:hypothetical protein